MSRTIKYLWAASIVLIGLLSTLGMGQTAGKASSEQPAKTTFLVVYSPGPAWIKGKPGKDQPLKDHFQFMISLYVKGVIKFAGPFADADGGAAVIETADDAEAKSIINADPGVKSGVMLPVIRRWDLVDWAKYIKK